MASAEKWYSMSPASRPLSDDVPETDEIVICIAEIDDHSNDDKPDTWINWVRALDTGKKVRNGGETTSQHFKVDFQSDATDTGHGSRVDFRIDGGNYHAVASPHTFTIASSGEHTIYLRGVDKWGNKDPSPATFSLIIIRGEDDYDDCDSDQYDDYLDCDIDDDYRKRIQHKDRYNKIEDSENDIQDTVKDSEKDIKNKVEDSEDDVIKALSRKLHTLEKNISDEHADQDEQLDHMHDDLNDVQKDVNTLKKGQKNLSADMKDQIDSLEKRIDSLETTLLKKIEDTEKDLNRKIEDSENDTIKTIIDFLKALFARILGNETDDKKQ
jgi:hypothetical protein